MIQFKPGWGTHHRHHEQISRMFMNNSNLSDQASVIVVELERTAMMYWLHEHVLKKMDMMFPHELSLHECRSMSSDVEISVVWMVPRNSGNNWSTCSGHRETLLSRSRRIFNQLRVTSKVKRRLTLTFRNHKWRRHAKSRMTDSQISLETVFPWDVAVHDAVHERSWTKSPNLW